MRRGLMGALCAVVAVGGAVAPSHRAQAAGPSQAAALIGPATSGDAAYVDGTYVWTDYAYDDDAAGYSSAMTNAADLIQLQVTPTGDGLSITALLETLLHGDDPRLVVGFDTDRNPSTGAGNVPLTGWAPTTPLGLDELVVVSHGDGIEMHWDGTEWVSAGDVIATVDTDANTIAVTVPSAMLDPGAATWSAVAAMATSDGVIHDLAFVGNEPFSGFQSAHQNAVLTGAAPATDAIGVIDFSALAAHTTAAPADATPGFHTRIYRSALDLGEGIGAAPVTLPGNNTVAALPSFYAGPYQPYLVWIGPAVDAAPAVIVYMHGFGGTHMSSTGAFGANGFNPNAVVVMPLGRGQDTFYFGAAEQDVLDATDDAIAHYGADTDRVVLSGVSMGGFGTYRLGTRYPDRWSALVPFIGTGGSPQYEFGAIPPVVRNQIFSPTGFPTGNAELLENINNVPLRAINGQIDPLVDNVLVTQDALRLDQLGYDYRSWVLLRRHHEVVPNLSSCVLEDAITKRRDADPARVVLSVEPEMFMHDDSTGLDLRYDHAYWVSHVQVADGVEKGTIDAISLARADRDRVSSRVLDAGQNITSGADLCGPNPQVQTNDAWRLNGIALTPAPAAPTQNAATIALHGLCAATLDLDAMHLTTDQLLTLVVKSDRRAVLTLTSTAGTFTVTVPKGASTHTI